MVKKHLWIGFFFLMGLCLGCSSPESEKAKLEKKIDKHCFRMASLLEKVETKEDFLSIASLFRSEMMGLVKLMGEGRAIAERFGPLSPSAGGLAFEKQLIRVYQLPFMDQLIHHYQQEALNALDRQISIPIAFPLNHDV